MNPLKTTDFQDMFGCQIKPLMHEQNSSVWDDFRLTAFSLPGCIAESASFTVDGEAFPLQ
jgi:hypothetical protein